MNKIKGAIFDMDGTLVESLMVWDVLWNKFGEKYCDSKKFRPSDDDDKAIRTMTLKEAMEYIHNIYGIGENGEELLEEANKLMENFYSKEVLLKKGVREFLDFCYENNIKMCVASATKTDLVQMAIKHCDIGKYFDKLFSCAEIGKGKEHPDIYLKTLEFMGTKKEETCVFEDSLVAIKTAAKIGLQTVAIYDKYNYGQEEMKK